MNIQGQTARVTAGGSGLCEATARELARLGAKVAVPDLDLDNARRVAEDIGGIAVACDVCDPQSMQQAVEQAAAAQLGRPEAFAALAAHIVLNDHRNGETIRLDGALRMAPR